MHKKGAYIVKKINVFFVCLALCIAFSACNKTKNNDNNEAFKDGKVELEAGNYKKALAYFELAQEEGNKDEEITELIDAINIYTDALDDYNDGEYEKALKTLKSIKVSNDARSFRSDISHLKQKIQDSIDSQNEVDNRLSKAEDMIKVGEYKKAEKIIKELDSDDNLSEDQEKWLTSLKHQIKFEKKNSQIPSETPDKEEDVYNFENDSDNAKFAVSNFAYAYEAFVKSGIRSSDAYYSYMSAYSPSWSNAYNEQWTYFNKHNITDYCVENLTFDSVTYDGTSYYVIDNETISEVKNGNLVRTTTKWKYTVIKDGDSFKVTNYASVK